MKSMNWFYLALVTVACWGLYGIYLHQGQVAMADKEHIGGCSGRVVAEDVGSGVEENALAVAALTPREHQDMLCREPGECVAEHPVDVGDQLRVMTEDACQEPVPNRSRCARRCLHGVADLLQ